MPSISSFNPTNHTSTEIDRLFLREAHQAASESDDPSAKYKVESAVGALIARGHLEIARAANILPPGLRQVYAEKGDIPNADRYFVIEHAERAAIFRALAARENLAAAAIYCTRFPCSDCARAIVFSGIRRMVVSKGFGKEKRWQESQRYALKILRGSGVVVRYLAYQAEDDGFRPGSGLDEEDNSANY